MNLAIDVIQIVIGLGILNVWLLRFNKQTPFRGGDARTMTEEFAVYGLPTWVLSVVGFLKISLAVLLILGVWVPNLTVPAAIGLAILMLGAVAMHVKVRDPLMKTLPALNLLLLCIVVAVSAAV